MAKKRTAESRQIEFYPVALLGQEPFIFRTFIRRMREKFHVQEAEAVTIFNRLVSSGQIVISSKVGYPGTSSYKVAVNSIVCATVSEVQK